ncbi:MAG: PAS domain-containing protein, partial [Candidatus Omnitrophota bacterium]
LTYVNPSAEKMFNIAASKSLGTNFRDYLTKGSQEEAVKAFLELSKGVTFRKLEFSAVHSDGHIFPIEAAASPIMKNRDFIGMEVIIRDVTKRRWAEDMLKESEERYRTLAEKANDGICVIQDKRSVYANPRFLEMMGYDFSEVLGKDFSGYVSPDTLESFNEEYKKHISGQERGQVFETVFVHRNGKNINVEVSASLVMYGRKRASLIFIRDITERRKMETEIKKNRKFLQDIFDGIQDGISVLDRDFNIINTNKWMEKMYADSMPIVGKKCYKIYQKRGETCPWCPSKKAMETGETQSSVVPYPSEETPAGWMLLSAFPLRDDKGNITGVVESVRDITEQKLAEKALKESEERFQQVVGSTKEWIWEVDKEGLYLYANPKIQEILGYKPEEVIGKKHFYDMFMPEEKEKLKKKALEVFARKEPFQEFLNRNMTKIGKIIWLLTNGVPVLDRKGELKGYRGADIDVTELKETEEALRKTIDELQKYKEVTVGRELQMIELKKKINELSKELGKPTPYDISFSD